MLGPVNLALGFEQVGLKCLSLIVAVMQNRIEVQFAQLDDPHHMPFATPFARRRHRAWQKLMAFGVP